MGYRLSYEEKEMKKAVRSFMFHTQGGKCAYCKCSMREKSFGKHKGNHCTLEHIIPNSLGGKISYLNALALCADCNSRRGNALFSRKQILAIIEYKSLIPAVYLILTTIIRKYKYVSRYS